MGDKTGISWTDATWNPIRGCSRVSEGCRNCYAERVAARFSGPGQPYEGLIHLHRRVKVGERDTRKHDVTVDGRKINDGLVTDPRWTGEIRLIPEHLADPLRWRKPRRIFVNSMSDLFHEKLTNEQIAAVFGVMAAAPQHTFQCLTKRAKRMREWFEWLTAQRGAQASVCLGIAESSIEDDVGKLISAIVYQNGRRSWPLSNVWLGVSVENQAAADERIPELLRTPAAVRFLSCEPLIGPVDLRQWVPQPESEHGGPTADENCARCGCRWDDDETHECPPGFGPTISWLIAGCESGPGARPCSVEWLRSLRDQCESAGVPYFLKQAVEEIAESTYPRVKAGAGSKRKAGGVIELPYLDGEQHAAFPEVAL